MKTLLFQLAIILVVQTTSAQDLPLNTQSKIENLSSNNDIKEDYDFQNHIFYMKTGYRIAATEYDFETQSSSSTVLDFLLSRVGQVKRSFGYTAELGNVFSVIKFSNHFRLGLDATYISVSVDHFDTGNVNQASNSPLVTIGPKLGPSFLIHLNKQISIYGGYKYHTNGVLNMRYKENPNPNASYSMNSNFGLSRYHSLNINLDLQVLSLGAYYEVGTTQFDNAEFNLTQNSASSTQSHSIKSRHATLTIFAALAF